MPPEATNGWSLWATATRVAELLGRRTAEISYHLHELDERGEIVSAQPWPAGLRGYQPGSRWRAEVPLFALPEPIADERRWMLDELKRWAAGHDGRLRDKLTGRRRRTPIAAGLGGIESLNSSKPKRSREDSATSFPNGAPRIAHAQPDATTATARAICSVMAALTASATAHTATPTSGPVHQAGDTLSKSLGWIFQRAADRAGARSGSRHDTSA